MWGSEGTVDTAVEPGCRECVRGHVSVLYCCITSSPELNTRGLWHSFRGQEFSDSSASGSPTGCAPDGGQG